MADSISGEDEHLFSGRFTSEWITLWIGAPGPDTLEKAAKLFSKATRHRLDKIDQGNPLIFQYGPLLGYREYLIRLAEFLTDEYRDGVVDPDSLALTCGATSGFHLAATTLMASDKPLVAFVECPTYFIALNVLKKDLNYQVVPIPMEPDGVDLDRLEAAIKREYEKEDRPGSGSKFWALFYTIPTFQNPMGSVLSPEKSKRLVQISRKYNVLIFCDDVYNILYYEGDKPPKRLLAYDDKDDPDYNGGTVISNGTFSKILSPGIRLGWIESGPRIITTLRDSGVLLSGGSLNNVMSGMLASALELGLQSDHVKYLRDLYRERLNVIDAVFKSDLPDKFQCIKPTGGYFLWVTGPKDFNAKDFAAFVKENFKVQVLPGSACSPIPESDDLSLSCSNAIRLSFAYYVQDKLAEGARQLCDALKLFYK